MLAEILDSNPDRAFVILDGLDEAIVGINRDRTRLKYCFERVISILSSDMDIDRQDAIDFFYYNVDFTRSMKNGPVFVNEYSTLVESMPHIK